MWAVLWWTAVLVIGALVAVVVVTRRAARARRTAHRAAVRALADDMASTQAEDAIGPSPPTDAFLRLSEDEPASTEPNPPRTMATAPIPAALDASIGRPATVLVVDDEPAVRDLAASVLALAGYHVLTAESGHVALDMWHAYGDSIDLLLTDIVMPQGMSGPQLAVTLLADAPGLPVVFTSGYSAETNAEGFSLVPGVNFLQKPYQLGTLVRVVRQALERGPST
jgi:CheY-like chemotaxis protein